jgi:hypothetical protein
MELFRLHNAERAIGCPGSLSLTPRVKLEPDADRERKKREGRTADWLIGKLLRQDPVFVGESGPYGVIVDDEMMSAATLYIDTIRTVTGMEPDYLQAEREAHLSWILDDYRLTDANPEDWVTDAAGRIWRCDRGLPVHKRWGLTGRSDYRVIRGTARHAYVFEFKYGHRRVEAENNPQLIGALLDHETLRYIDSATLVVVQPRDLYGETVRVWNVDTAMINYWRSVFIYAVWQSNQPDAPLNVGPWCKTCDAAGLCPAKLEELMRQMTVLDAPQTLTPAEVGERLSLVLGLNETSDTMKTVLKMQALSMIKDGQIVPGFKVVRGVSRRSLKRFEELESIAMMFGVERGSLFVEKPRPLGELEKLLPSEIIDMVTEKPIGALEVAPEGDKRTAAIENNPAAVFGPAIKPE